MYEFEVLLRLNLMCEFLDLLWFSFGPSYRFASLVCWS